MAEPQAQQAQSAQPQAVDYDALAKQYGATEANASPTPTPPQGQASTQTQTDYDALAKQYGAVEGPSATPQTPAFTPEADNLSTGGEGSNSDQQLMSEESQKDATRKGLTIAATAGPAVVGLAASPLISAGTAIGSLIDAGGNPVIKAIATEYGASAINAIKEAATAHPIVAKLLLHALASAGGLTLAKYMNLFSGK
jgi:hypothetical protein